MNRTLQATNELQNICDKLSSIEELQFKVQNILSVWMSGRVMNVIFPNSTHLIVSYREFEGNWRASLGTTTEQVACCDDVKNAIVSVCNSALFDENCENDHEVIKKVISKLEEE